MMRHLGIISILFFCLAFPRTTQAACDTPNLLIILDKSGSMTNGNKWSAAKSALQSMIQTYENKVRFGLISFSDQPALDAVLPSTQSTIVQAVQRIEPKGQTFMVPALQSATNHLREVLFQDTLKGRSTNILFLTDGAPSDRCPVAEVEALQQLSINNTRYPIKTFVIGFGTLINPNCLNQLAEKGQTARTGATKYPPHPRCSTPKDAPAKHPPLLLLGSNCSFCSQSSPDDAKLPHFDTSTHLPWAYSTPKP